MNRIGWIPMGMSRTVLEPRPDSLPGRWAQWVFVPLFIAAAAGVLIGVIVLGIREIGRRRKKRRRFSIDKENGS